MELVHGGGRWSIARLLYTDNAVLMVTVSLVLFEGKWGKIKVVVVGRVGEKEFGSI